MGELSSETKLSVGFDLDGIIASPLFDGLLIKTRILKEHLLKSLGHKSDYFYPRTEIERRAWVFLNRLRRPNVNSTTLEALQKTGASLYLITSRFKFIEEDTRRWLKKYGLDTIFDAIYINNQDLNPINFKASILNENSIDYYIDDDLEVLTALKALVGCKLYWLGGNQRSPDSRINNVPSLGEFVTLLGNV